MNITAVVARLAIVALMLQGESLAAESPTSRCADCHFANSTDASRWHLSEWDHSAHGRADVGCEGCHGGDPSTFEPFLAHRGMLGARNPASPVHRTNLPRTCGGCHPAAFAAFSKSRHHELLRAGSPDTPTCTTCHGNAGAHLLSPRSLAAECNACHGSGKVAPNSDLPALGRMRLAEVREVRASLDETGKLIRRVQDKALRASLELELEEARAPLKEAVDSAHRFVFDQMQERILVTRKRTDLLVERLANAVPLSGKQVHP